jgi:hypothetical protein
MQLFKKIKSKIRELLFSYFPDSEFGRMIFYIPVLRKFDFSHSRCFRQRTELYDYIHANYVKNNSISYLEFGVFKGESFFHWLRLNTNPNSEFYGFDTFTGLPENWQKMGSIMRKNHFDTNGSPPLCDDKRCRFVKGMFQDTLPGFLKSIDVKEKLVIHNDSDLYSSTLYTLVNLHSILRKGTIIIFDEFSLPLHELRAFDDYVKSHLVDFRIIAHTKNYIQVAVELY